MPTLLLFINAGEDGDGLGNMPKVITIEDVYKTCEEIGLICLSTEYKGIKEDLTFVCSKCNKNFQRNYDNIKNRRNTECSMCGKKHAEKPTKFTYDYVKEYVEQISDSGCKLLSKEYNNIDSDLEFLCKCGRQFTQTFYEFKNRQFIRCKTCRNIDASIRNLTPLDTIIEIVNKENYIFICNDVPGKDQRMLVQCDKGHDPYWVSVVKFKSGRRCPHCARSLGEESIKRVLENYKIEYKPEFKFSDLIGTGGGLLRFDFGIFKNKKLECLLEYDGLQHFEVSFNSPESFETTKKHDKIKNEYAKNNKIKLFRIPYTEYKNIDQIMLNILAQIELV